MLLLRGIDPPWTLSGGAALAGYYTQHRTTRDLDLFFRGARSLGRAVPEVERRLQDEGLTSTRRTSTPTFARIEFRGDDEVLLLDLVADSTPTIEPPAVVDGVQVDTAHEILVNKCTALLSRSEVRDLADIEALVADGGDLGRALRDAPRKDAGFSPLTLAWLLHQFPLHAAEEQGFDEARLRAFRDRLIERLTERSG